jgi:hypothetical protein
VTQYLEFNEFLADSIGFIGVNPKYCITARYIGIFLRYGLSKTGITFASKGTTYHTLLERTNAGPIVLGLFICL